MYLCSIFHPWQSIAEFLSSDKDFVLTVELLGTFCLLADLTIHSLRPLLTKKLMKSDLKEGAQLLPYFDHLFIPTKQLPTFFTDTARKVYNGIKSEHSSLFIKSERKTDNRV